MNKTLTVAFALLLGLCDASAITLLYDRPFESNPPPQEEPPWMTVDVDGSVFTFKITTSAILESVYFKVENPEKVSIKATDDPVSTRVVTDSRLDYNLAFDFGVDSEGVSYSQYTLSLDGWDGAFLMSDEGFLSVAQFGNSIWAADCVRVPVPDAGSTLAFLGVSLLGLNQARRWWR